MTHSRFRLQPSSFFITFLLLFCSILQPSSVAQSSERPNIVLIMADDMGYSDIGAYGGEIQTPALDRLAEGGLRFTQFYNTARCCPTRASLQCGLYPHQTGVGGMINDRQLPGYRGDLNDHCLTIARVLGNAGYATYMSGKWHLTPVSEDKHNRPLQRGYDRFFGTIYGAGSYYDPNSLSRGNKFIPPHKAGPEFTNDNFYYTDAISANAARYVKQHASDDQSNPFFMYVAYTAPHWPMHAPEETVEKYEGRYKEGWGTIRKERYKRMTEMRIIKDQWKLSDRDHPRWEQADNQKWHRRNMAVYAAMVDRMDQGIGHIVRTLKETDQFKNTLLLFLADNGGCAEGLGRGGDFTPRPDEPVNPMGKDELQKRMIPKFTRDGYPVRKGTGVMPGPPDTYIAYGKSWANVSNTPFREYKHWVHEGGISTPLIAHWPAGIDRKGELERQPGHVVDIMATSVDVAGAEYPDTFDGHRIRPMQGVSLVPAFLGNDLDRDQPLFFEHEGNRALRDGKWKVVAKGAGGEWELYNMEADRSETNNLADKYPDRTRQLAMKWEDMARQFNALPWPRGNYRGPSRTKETFHFELGPGEDIARTHAPYVKGRPFTMSIILEEAGNQGVIVAQGGSTDGYALYQKQNHLYFATTHRGDATILKSKNPLPDRVTNLTVSLRKDGTVTVEADGTTVVKGKTKGPLVRLPLDGLQVGQDKNGAVGSYSTPFPYNGRVKKVEIDLEKTN